ncbi:hypothetical protein Q7P37_008042 [Cladosporium fusiforme]
MSAGDADVKNAPLGGEKPHSEEVPQELKDVAKGANPTPQAEPSGEKKPQRPGMNRFTTSKENVLSTFFIGAIDQGTTSTRFIIFDGVGQPVASHQHEFKQHYPESGWHEHDPQELLASLDQCIEKATTTFIDLGHNVKDIRAIGLTNQRETALVWDAETGEALHPAIAWPDTRTKAMVRDYKEKEIEQGLDLQELTGLPLSTYSSSVKLVWLLENVPKVKEAYDAGRLAFGTVDTWLLFHLNGGLKGQYFVTDSTNASRTGFMNLHTLKYDDKLLNFFGIDREKLHLPQIVPSSDAKAYGYITKGLCKGIKIAGCLGDQSAALVGQQGFTPGSAKNTYGTGCFMLYNVGEKPVISHHGLLATVAYDFGGKRKPAYALEGSVAVAGSGVKFLMNNMGFITHSHKISDLAATVEDNGGCVFVTAFSGLFAPYWIDDAKGTIFGITQHTQRGHIARATLEATCFQTRAILNAMEKDSGHALSQLAVDGGMSNSGLCMQTQANIIGIPVDRPSMAETTALGAAIAAGFAVGIWTEFDELKAINQKDRQIFKPAVSKEESEKMFAQWERAVRMCKGWLDPQGERNEA